MPYKSGNINGLQQLLYRYRLCPSCGVLGRVRDVSFVASLRRADVCHPSFTLRSIPSPSRGNRVSFLRHWDIPSLTLGGLFGPLLAWLDPAFLSCQRGNVRSLSRLRRLGGCFLHLKCRSADVTFRCVFWTGRFSTNQTERRTRGLAVFHIPVLFLKD